MAHSRRAAGRKTDSGFDSLVLAEVSAVQIRQADIADAPVVAQLFRASFRHTYPHFPELHTAEEDLQFFSTTVFPQNRVYVAEAGGSDAQERIVGFIAFTSEMVNQLYILPDATGQGVGTALLAVAIAHCKTGNEASLQLWTFQCNLRARNFYSKHGFKEVRETDGAENEECQPDGLLEYRPAQTHGLR